ncbi:hypothetical protein [Aquirufa nivalisilvae]
MAIAIKSVPILKDKVARKFVNNAEKALKLRGTVDFTKQVEITNRILAKANMR